jgi:hypothetical protein
VQEEDNTNSESKLSLLHFYVIFTFEFSAILLILASIFLFIVICCIIELIRNNRAYKRRQRQQDEMWMPPKYTESVLSPPVKMVGFKSVRELKFPPMILLQLMTRFQLDAKVNGNGTELQPLTKNEAINSNHSSPPNGSPPQKKVENLMMKGMCGGCGKLANW